jgi:NosR/NirI family nitrous oxide reductase transcriptional regulator
MRLLAGLLRVALLLPMLAIPEVAIAQDYVTNPPALISRLTPDVVAVVYPGAGRLVPVEGGTPAVAVYEGNDVAGYIFSSLDLLRARGYVVTPFDVIAGVTIEGVITGAMQVFSRESYVVNNVSRTELLAQFLASLAGANYLELRDRLPAPNFVAGASVTATSMRTSVGDGARIVMRSIVGVQDVTEPTLDRERFVRRSVDQLVAQGSLATLTLTNADVTAALDAAGLGGARLDTTILGEPEAIYIKLSVGLASVPTIGRSIVSDRTLLDRLRNDFPAGTLGILVGSTGAYNFQGSRYRNASSGFAFERIDVVQGERTFAFRQADYIRVGPSPIGEYAGIFAIRPYSGFDPLQPWTVRLHVSATQADGTVQTVSFPLEYRIPALHVLMPAPPPVPAWVETWERSRMDIVILGVALFVLTLIFVFQPALTARRRLHRYVRTAFLVFTLVWLGYIAGGQLSIIHITNFLTAPLHHVDIGFYLAEPLIVMIVVYGAISMILIGRGVFCGWLCPFGALQELLYKVGRFLRLPDWNPRPSVQRWLWLPKYGTAALVIATAFLAPEVSAATTEIEPFKTVITSAFTRPWLYLVYAGLVLSAGLFSERAFCRFLCPLGGFLAVLDRLHLINLLKRRPECGSSCHLCERSCPVKAISPSGKIVTAECFQCLDCQVEYYDDRRCPPLAKGRKLRDRAASGGQAAQPVPVLVRQAGLATGPRQ